MLTRRQAIGTTALLAGGSVAAIGSVLRHDANAYKEAVLKTWYHAPDKTFANASLLNRELARYATLAPSSHNTQCWKFKLEDRRVSILPDWSRRCPVVDPDDHHLFVSLGCATENLMQAAKAFGKQGELSFDTFDRAIRISLESTQAEDSPLFEAIPDRQCTRAEYDGLRVPNNDLKLLEKVSQGKGVKLLLLSDRQQIEKVLEYVVQGNTAQIGDRAFVKELKAWIRFSDAEAVSERDGLFARSSGNPTLPRWLGSKLFNWFLNAETENDKYAKHIRSSAGIAIFVSEENTWENWVEVGRCYERFALQTTALGIRNAFLNQPVEVASLRPQFASFLGIGEGRPDLVVRFGYGSELPRSLRRPVEAAIAS